MDGPQHGQSSKLQTITIEGLGSVILPAAHDERQYLWDDPDTPSAHSPRSPTPQQQQLTKSRPWWMRLLVDSMAIPFIQGFMLNLGIHWIRHWRRSGGLVGVFRNRFSTRKPDT